MEYFVGVFLFVLSCAVAHLYDRVHRLEDDVTVLAELWKKDKQ